MFGSTGKETTAPAQAAPGAAAMRRAGRVGLLYLGALVLLFGVVLARVGQLQAAPSAALREHMSARTARAEIPALRGDLLDRRGRLLSATRFGFRVIVDPVLFANARGGALDQAIVELAQAGGFDPGTVGERIVRALAENERRLASAEAGPGPVGEDPRDALRGLLSAFGGGGGGEAVSADEAPDNGSVAAGADGARRPIRYLPVGETLEKERAEAVETLRLAGVYLERRPLREYSGGAAVASIVGKVGFEHEGLLGAERTLDERLRGSPGSLLEVRDARGRALWVQQGRVEAAERGDDIRLSIDLALQRIATEELERGIEEADAAGGRLVMIEPNTGEVLAMVDLIRIPGDAVPFPWVDRSVPRGQDPGPPAWGKQRFIVLKDDPGRKIHPALGRNRCVEDVYEPGSTFKTFMWATVTELGRAQVDEVFDTEGGVWRTSYGRRIEDVTRRDEMTWEEVLSNSSNIGMVKATERLSAREMHAGVQRFGFGQRTGIGLPGESPGITTDLKNWNKYTHTSVAFGNEVAVTPVQMVRAFAAFARSGRLAGTLGDIRLTSPTENEPPPLAARVVSEPTVQAVRRALTTVVQKMDEGMKRRDRETPEPTYTMFGKSGTAMIPLNAPPGKRRPTGTRGYYEMQYNSSFIAAGPTAAPRLVVLVVIDDPGPERIRRREHYGSSVAGPVVRRVMERSLRYLGVPPDAGEAARATPPGVLAAAAD